MENSKQSTKTDMDSLIQSLSNVDWSELFIGCKDTDAYAQRFHDTLQTALSGARYTTVKRSRPNLPNYILQLTHVKRKLWKTAKLNGDTSQFKAARRLVRRSIRNYYKIKEEKLINQKDCKKFYAYLNSRIKNSKSTAIKLYDGNLTDVEIANIFSKEFGKNFNGKNHSSTTVDLLSCSSKLTAFSCGMSMLRRVVSSSRNTASGPDGFSMAMIKQLFHCICYQLLVICQQSLFNGKFLAAWKLAHIVPIYKNKGERSEPSAYRPISLYSCYGKIIERIVKEQLTKHLYDHFPLHNAQHDFLIDRSTTTNLAACDALIADCISLRHPYDIITIDLQKAFDKVPHDSVIDALRSRNITGAALAWFDSFLSNRTQQVRICNQVFNEVSVLSGSIQGSVLNWASYVLGCP